MAVFALAASDALWLVVTTAVALIAGAASGWIAAVYRRREAKEERIREEVLRWTNPVLGTVSSLESRLENILEDGLHVALDPRVVSTDRPVHPDWSVSYSYTMPTTLFLFAEYFAWIRLLQERLSFELFESQSTKDSFSTAIWRVSKSLASWPKSEISGEGRDTQVFALQQRLIGELLIHRDEPGPRTMTVGEFLATYSSNGAFRESLEPLRSLLEAIEPGTKRWSRLEVVLAALRNLDRECRELLGPPDRGGARKLFRLS